MNIAYKLAQYIMRSRPQVVLVGLLSSPLPLTNWMSHVVVALVTLRQGAIAGMLVLLWVILPIAVLASVVEPWLWLYSILGGGFLSYGPALLLCRTGSWTLSLQALMLLGTVAVLIIHLFIPELQVLWSKQLGRYILTLKFHLKLNLPEPELQFLTARATGIQTSGLLLNGPQNLGVARWLQSLLYNPGQLAPELSNIRLHKWIWGIVVCVLIGGFYNSIGIAQDSFPVVMLITLLAGLSCL